MGELADRYARAFLEAGGDQAQLARSALALEGEAALWEALTSPAVEPEEKRRVLSRLPELAPPGPVSRLFGLMAERGRLPCCPRWSGPPGGCPWRRRGAPWAASPAPVPWRRRRWSG